MNLNIFRCRSLKARVTIFTLAIFLIGFWSLTFFASHMLREDMQHLLGDQQFSTVSILAAQVNQELDDRLRSLEKIAKEINPSILGDPAALQALLERHPVLQSLFNGGTFVTGIEGIAIVDVSLSAGRLGLNYMDRDFIAAALKEGKSTIGQPVIGKKLQTPVFSIGVPIWDTQGKVIGVLAGTTNLAMPNFMDKISQSRYGMSGGYFLVARQYRLIVTASDKTRVMEHFPAPGINPTLDRYIQGYEGSAVYVNPLGVEVLGSAKGIPVAGWFLGAILPTQEAFAPIRDMQQRMLLTTILLTLLAGSLTWWMTWWMLRRHLSPMLAATEMLIALSDTNQPPQPLPITTQDEIGQLIGGFNRLLETLVQREEALIEYNKLFTLFMRHSPVYCYIKDVNSKRSLVLQASENYQDMIGIPGSEMVGKTMEELFPPEFAAKISADDLAVVSKGDVLRLDEELNGRSYTSIKFPIVLGDKTLLAGYTIDITERKQAEAEKEKIEAQNRQFQKAKSLNTMAGAIAHHFNNQLHVVTGNLEMAMDALPRDADTFETLTEVLKAARKAAEVSGLLLTYIGQTPGKREPIDLSEVCRRSLTLLQAAAPKGIMLKADFPSSGPVIRAKACQIQQALTHLITNAWESAGEKQGAICLTVKTVSHANIPDSNRFPIDWQPQEIVYACLEVADEGHGIPDSDIEKLFDPFFTTKFTGRGLGLPVVLGIVRAHGGGIVVESEPGRGSVFRIFLPVSGKKIPILPEKEGKAPEIEGGCTVLLVEDEEQVRKMVKIMLTRLGFIVLTAKDGVEAIEVFRQHQDEVRCVLSDLTMPRMGGWDTLAALRKLSPDIPVILSSGYDEAHVMAGEHPERPNAFLGKPYQLKGLSDTINRILS
ncbi:MAG: ATP-binding protein [Deltaproteobacteria bacterium]|nr:ATP-binding protein [Deltaproteobacteria bacterium]